jgi:DNA repair protein RecN (Recombination protein N)
VARRLLRLARHRQVLVVTHTASIAAAADAHAVVRKQVDGGKVRTEVRMVQGQERIEELARLLSGQPAAAIAQEHARSLLDSMAGVRSDGGPASGPDRL